LGGQRTDLGAAALGPVAPCL